MQKKITGWKTKGMNRDLSVSAFNSEFSFENRNLRLSTNDGNTLMSWVNEKGPKEIALYIDANPWRDDLGLEVEYSYNLEGTPIGTAVLNENLIIFTTDQGTDRIYVLQYSANSTASNPSMEGKILYLGHLNFSTQHPLETLSSYESTDIQKVYWTDGYNQPRFINIKASHDKLKIWHSNYESGSIDTFFDFVPAVKNNSTIVVSKNYNGGVFAPGVIQYAFTYINKYGQQSNIVDISPLYYNSHSDRGASPEEKVNNSYNITIENVDTTFDFIRLYSIQRTSTDATPIIKVLDDISLKDTIKKTTTIIPDPIPGELQVTLTKITEQEYRAQGYKMLPEVSEDGVKKYITTNQVEGGTYSYFNRYGTASFMPNIYKFQVKCLATSPEPPAIDLTLFADGQELIEYIIDNSPRDININDYYASYYFAEWLLKRRAEEKLRERSEELLSNYTIDDYSLDYSIHVQPVPTEESAMVYTQPFYRTLVYDYSNMAWCLQQNGTSPIITPQPTLIQPDPIEGDVTESVQYVDTGTTGSSMDSTELLYVGGKDITALTMAEKDNTLFLGNITQFNYSLTSIQEYFDSIRDTENGIVINYNYDDNKSKQETLPTSVYSYSNNLNKNSAKITTFKGGETYRFGFQLQKATGEWSDPIFIDDVTNNNYPRVSLPDNKSELVSAYGTLNINTIQEHFNSDTDFYTLYKSIRPVIVFPSIQERSVLCQGVLNPTVFNVVDRKDNTPFAQASWYYRPYCLSRSAALTNYESPTLPTVSGSGSATDPTPFVQKNLMQSVYVLRLKVKSGTDAPTSAQLEKALSKGVITKDYTSNSWDTDPDPNYLGYVPVGNENNVYLLFKSTPWEDPTTVTYIIHSIWGNHTVHRDWQDWVETHITTGEAYRICSSIKAYNRPITSDGTTYPAGVLYYVQPADISINPYIISVRNGASHQGSYYYISFDVYKNPRDFNIPVGSEAPFNKFTHYNTLPEDADTSTLPSNGYPEIQGAHNIINSVFNTSIDAHPIANNQYFVDQSIVTLNSPDIEFDSSVSNVGTEGFKLRVVGVIPITSNVSSHSISASSAMEGLKAGTGSEAGDTLKFGVGELGRNIQHNNLSMFAGIHLNSKYLWNDARLSKPTTDGTTKKQTVTSNSLVDFAIYPWHRTGSLANDLRKKDETSSLLKNKREAELLYSLETEYFPNKIEFSDSSPIFNHIDFQIHQTENTQILNMKLKKQHGEAFDINYYPNIDKVLYNTNGYSIKGYDATDASPDFIWGLENGSVAAGYKAYDPVSMKYLSTSHAVIALQTDDVDVPLLPYAQYTDGCDITVTAWGQDRTSNFNIGKYSQAVASNTTYWGDSSLAFTQQGIPMNTLDSRFFDFLWLGEIYKEVDRDTMFGGRSDTALRANNWLIGGKSVSLDPNSMDENGNITLVWSEGDTYYQRYDSLKTYASTEEDTNSIIEILSFMCETRVNIDGRYDKNRAQQQNHNMRPQIFNVINPAYSQKNNYFTYKKLNEEGSEILKYPQYLTYSRPKTSGADIDLYTNVTMASVLELDGDSGSLNALERVNDRLIAFQDTGISQILYNENVQVSPEQGMPIEIANSGKVQGAKYLSNTVGCSNKWSVANTPGGVYFIDSTSRSIYLFADSLMNLSAKAGMNSWVKQNLPKWNKVWNPETFDNFVTYYDKLNQETMFINPDTCLTFSEQISAFTSLYDYGNAPYFVNLGDTGVWLSKNNAENNSNYKLWQHNAGNYCNFFGVNKPYSLTLIGNPDPQMDKIFTNLEFRATIEGDGSEINNNFSPYLPFNTLEVWNEYQHGIATLQDRNGHSAMKHHELNNTASLKRKFRMWRCDIPRDNAPLNTDASRGVSRTRVHPIDRMRNPWLYLKLQKEPQANMPKAEIHDLLMTYFD